RGPPLFAAAAALYRRANRRVATSPLQFARALLGLMEQRRAPRSRTGLLREALARAASAGDGRPAASRLARAVERVILRLRRARPGALAGAVCHRLEEKAEAGARRIRLSLSLGGRPVTVDLLPARPALPCFFRARRFQAIYHNTAAPRSPRARRQLDLLLRLLDRGVETDR
ncbi:MAG: hypothetical protein PHU21_11815, partial [Elusimicrobia bacterium]|nr:hypothetical protein [Elusimicrobiota bacterium]